MPKPDINLSGPPRAPGLLNAPFRVGQKVECIDASPGSVNGLVFLTLGVEYTVSSICPEILQGERGMYVAEIPEAFVKPGIKCSRFRAITDISVFTALLTRVIEKA